MKKKKPVIVYTYGVFDLLHGGHIDLLKEARALGDRLVLGLFTDEVAASFKRVPVMSFEHRMKVLEQVRLVDRIVVQKELPPDKNLRKHRPHILAKGPGAGWSEDHSGEAPGEKTMKKLGGKVVRLKYHHGISTGEIIKKIKESQV